MTRVKITTPVTDHSGIVGHVYITDGVGFADSELHAAEIAYCRRNGYTVEEVETPSAEDLGFSAAEVEAMEAADAGDEPNDGESGDEPPADDLKPRRNGSAEAWRAYAVAHGMPAEEADELTRDQLVERFTSSEETDA